mmetsp:Transcript_19526/g.31060  ORF Transcript_19526/g.31060 Transcript_19526/m.31060 type:complete len:207 (-) Transcript_19526:580-1200(-)
MHIIVSVRIHPHIVVSVRVHIIVIPALHIHVVVVVVMHVRVPVHVRVAVHVPVVIVVVHAVHIIPVHIVAHVVVVVPVHILISPVILWTLERRPRPGELCLVWLVIWGWLIWFVRRRIIWTAIRWRSTLSRSWSGHIPLIWRHFAVWRCSRCIWSTGWRSCQFHRIRRLQHIRRVSTSWMFMLMSIQIVLVVAIVFTVQIRRGYTN